MNCLNLKRNTKKIVTLIISLILLLFAIYFSNNLNKIDIIKTEKEKDEIIKNKKNIGIELKYDDENIPKYDDGYLISFINEKEMIDKLSSKYEYVIYTKDTYENIIKNNQYIELIVLDNNNYDIKKIYLTNLSVVNIQNEEFTIFENNDEIKSRKINLEYHVRGGTSRFKPKKSYKVNLSEKVEILEMRKDDDWILNPMSLDYSLVREKIAYDIWNDMSAINNHKLEYVELFLEGEYKGVYYLQEPVDQHTFNEEKYNTFYYSVKQWSENKPLKLKYIDGEVFANEFSFDKLDESRTEESFDVLNVLCKDISSDELDRVIYDEKNLYDYELFINMINALDNSYKNQKFAITNKNDDLYFTKTPWDLDWSMNNPNNKIAETSLKKVIKDSLKNKIYVNEKHLKKQAELYFKYRREFYNEQYILNKVNEYYNQVFISGAYIRNNKQWDIENELFLKDIDNIKTSLINRMMFLDDYYGEFL